MGQTRFSKAKDVLERYVHDTRKKYIYTENLRSLIITNIAGTPSIILQTLKMLRETKIIEEVKMNKWRINLDA
jgi:hypothetical protein